SARLLRAQGIGRLLVGMPTLESLANVLRAQVEHAANRSERKRPVEIVAQKPLFSFPAQMLGTPGSAAKLLMKTIDGIFKHGAHQRRFRITGGTAGPIAEYLFGERVLAKPPLENKAAAGGNRPQMFVPLGLDRNRVHSASPLNIPGGSIPRTPIRRKDPMAVAAFSAATQAAALKKHCQPIRPSLNGFRRLGNSGGIFPGYLPPPRAINLSRVPERFCPILDDPVKKEARGHRPKRAIARRDRFASASL